jgi:hypothetical protein
MRLVFVPAAQGLFVWLDSGLRRNDGNPKIYV